MKRRLIAAAALLAVSGWVHAQVVNGSFEDDPVTKGTFIDAPPGTISGWTTFGTGTVSLVNGNAPHLAFHGDNFVDLLGALDAPKSWGNGVSQTVTLAKGLYELSFYLGATGYHDASALVEVMGIASGIFTTAAGAGGVGDWTNTWVKHTLPFEADAAGDYTFSFTGLRVASTEGPISTGLDMVNVVPEPSAYALALAGIGVLGLLGRRRRQQG